MSRVSFSTSSCSVSRRSIRVADTHALSFAVGHAATIRLLRFGAVDCSDMSFDDRIGLGRERFVVVRTVDCLLRK
jgi:hypothetical protein